jgi:hypothetical protein
MRAAITITIIIGVLILIILFVLAVLFSLHMNDIYKFISETFTVFLNNGRTVRRERRERRNAVYPQPSQISEIEMTPISKKNFIIIENPNSPYTLGIEYLTE